MWSGGKQSPLSLGLLSLIRGGSEICGILLWKSPGLQSLLKYCMLNICFPELLHVWAPSGVSGRACFAWVRTLPLS